MQGIARHWGPRGALALIVVAGLLLRISGIFWGIPWDRWGGWYHPDEHYVFDAAIWTSGIVTETESLFYPTFFQHLLILLTLPLRFYFDPLTEEFRIAVALVARFCSVAAGTGAIYGTYRLVCETADRNAALLASALLAFSLYHAQNSSFGTTDVLTSFFLVLFLLFLVRAFRQPDRIAPFLLSGAALGLLVGSKYTGVLAIAIVPVLYAHNLMCGWRRDRTVSPPGRVPFSSLLLCGLTSVVVFIVTTPGPLFDLPAFLELMRTMATHSGWTETSRGTFSTWLVTYRALIIAVGWPLTWLAILGLVVPWKRNVQQWGFVVLLVAFLAYFGAALFPRYVITVTPVIAIIAGNAALAFHQFGRRFRLSVLTGPAIALVVAYSAGYCVVGAYNRLDDTRTDAARYLNEHFATGTGLGIGYTSVQRALDEYPRWMNPHADYSLDPPRKTEVPRWWIWMNPSVDYSPERLRTVSQRWSLFNFPRIDFTHFTYEDFLDYPEVLVLSSQGFDEIQAALQSEKLSKDYIWDPRYNGDWYWLLPPSPRVFAFYASLLDREKSPYTLVKTFAPRLGVPIEFGAPEIRIYVASSLVSKYHRERASLSLSNVHYYPPYSDQATRYPANPRGYFHKEDLRPSTWTLNTQPGSAADLEFPEASPELIRIAIHAAGDPTPWHVQLSQRGLPTRRGATYVLSFRARAETPRHLGVGVGRTHGDWGNVGLYQNVDVTEAWQPFRFEFAGTSDEDAARIHFDLGGNVTAVDLDNVRLEVVGPNGMATAVESQPPSYVVDYRFNGTGCRGADYAMPAPADTTRVLLLGNSWTLGAGVHEADTLPSQLQTLLNAADGNRRSGRRWEVINCGANDYGPREARLFYEQMASHYTPSVVLLHLSPPDSEVEVDVTRIHIPRVTSRLTPASASTSPGGDSRRDDRIVDAIASSKEIVQLAHEVKARGARFGVLLTRDEGNVEWTRFESSVAANVKRDAIPVGVLGLYPDGSDRNRLVVYPGLDHRPNEIAHRLLAQQASRFIRMEWTDLE